MKSIILLSGGLDSVVSLAVCKKEYNIELALTFDYGQKAASSEILASKKIAEFYNIKHQVIQLPWLANITTTALVESSKSINLIDEKNLDNLECADKSAKKVWVPNRNGLFLNIAASFADSYNYTNILFGANKEEATTFPDNSQQFIDEINKSFKYSTLQKPEVIAPLVNQNKKEIIDIGIANNVPLRMVRSCYLNNDSHCGECESCLRLKRALEEAGALSLIKELF